MHHHGGDRFCRDLTGTLRYAKPQAIQIAEYWDWDRAFAVVRPPEGLGFDAALGDRLRDAVRGVLAEASAGAGASVHLDRVRDALYTRRVSRPLGQLFSVWRTMIWSVGTTTRTAPAPLACRRWRTRPTRAPGTPAAAAGSRPRFC